MEKFLEEGWFVRGHGCNMSVEVLYRFYLARAIATPGVEPLEGLPFLDEIERCGLTLKGAFVHGIELSEKGRVMQEIGQRLAE